MGRGFPFHGLLSIRSERGMIPSDEIKEPIGLKISQNRLIGLKSGEYGGKKDRLMVPHPIKFFPVPGALTSLSLSA
jgi:hypothetical protein